MTRVETTAVGAGGPDGAVWDGLVAAAVLGTGRRPFAGVALAGPAGAVVDRAVRTAGLAGAAAALWAYRQAGRAPARQVGAGPEPAPLDDRPLLGPGPVRSLRAVLDDPALRPVLPEWLHLAAGSGCRLPAEWLPDLLDACRPPERAALGQVAGARGRWLAGLNPDWSSTFAPRLAGPGGRLARAVLAGGEEAWEAAGDVPDAERILAFAAVRSADADLGRRLAGGIWPGESGATRAAIVAALADGLSMADEPFLEDRLDDRRRDVRTEAAALLRRLPASRQAHRMAARTVPLVRLDGGGRGGGGLQIDRPGPSGREAGSDDAGDLTRMVAATPLAVWEEALGRPPADLVARAARSGDDGSQLIDGWAAATTATSDANWARALLGGGARPDADLLRLVARDLADRAVVGWLRRAPLPEALPVLGDLPAPWSPQVSGAVLDRLGGLVRAGETAGAGPVRDRLGMVAVALHPDQAPATAALASAAEQLPSGPRGAARVFWARSFASMAATVHFRQAMHQEFR